jgi:4-hydroxyphenylpyruvate dioxygenase-like putative hemolysin
MVRKSAGRIDHFIWVVRQENLETYVDQARRIFDAEFEHMHGPTLAGTDRDCYVSWDAGLEFIAPLGRADPTSAAFLDFLEKHGEGPWGFVFAVEDLAQAVSRARAHGCPVGELVQSPESGTRHAMMSRWTSRVDDVREIYVDKFLGTGVMFGDINYVET